MLYVFIGGTDRTGDIDWDSLNIDDELQERVNTASFKLHSGNRPDDYDEVLIYDGTEIVTVGADYVTVKDLYTWKSLFRVNDEIYVGLNTGDEAKYTISAIDTSTNKITFSTNLSGISAGEFIGHRIFGGIVQQVQDENLHLLQNIIFQVDCTDFTKLFDMNQIVDTFADRSPRYIINDMCNTFINYNEVLDQLDYASNGDIQAAWADSGVANNPTTDSTDPYEKDHWGSFASSGSGTATWTASALTTVVVNNFTGVSSGMPTSGYLRFWIKHTDYTKITSYTFRIGSDSSNYIAVTKTPAQLGITSNDETYCEIDLTDFSDTGTPDWTGIDYALIEFICTASTTVKLAGLRIMEENYFAHYPYCLESSAIDDFNVNYMKPMAVMQRLAQSVSYFWYIDYDRYIHFFDQEENNAPFDLTETSDNFEELSIKVDAKNLKNVQYVEGGENTSTSTYSEVKKGNAAAREWTLKSKFAGLVIKLDDQTTTHPAEAGTNATNITITGHGLATGDYITNRSRSDAVREVTYVDANNVTVESVTGQTNGDTISYFDQTQTSGIEGIVDDSSYDYVYNSNAKSVRSGSATDTLDADEYLLFTYNEKYPIISAAQNGASIAALQATLGYTDGQVIGAIIRDKQIQTQEEAKMIASAEVERYGNAIMQATFYTHIYGLQSGQQIRITDSTSGRAIDQNFIIQKVSYKPIGGNMRSKVTASSVLYGIVEFFQQLIKASLHIEFDAAAVPVNLIFSYEEVTMTDTGDEKSKTTNNETVTITDNCTATDLTPPFAWNPDANGLVWSLGEWG